MSAQLALVKTVAYATIQLEATLVTALVAGLEKIVIVSNVEGNRSNVSRTSLALLTFKKCISIATMIKYYPEPLLTLLAS